MTLAAANRLKRVFEFIQNNLNTTLLVEDIANVAHCSRWQLQRDFSNEMGMSIGQYVRQLKMTRASKLLKETDYNQLKIAQLCGFESEISFHRSFKREFDYTPGQYRKLTQVNP